MKLFAGFLCSAVLAVTLPAAAEKDNRRAPLKAMHGIELDHPSGGVALIHSSERDYPGFDVIHLSVKSDGKQLTIAATLKDAPGVFASRVLNLYFDTDNSTKTGAQFVFPKIGGFEYKGELDACADYADKSSACTGGSKAKVTAHYAAVELDRFKGTGQYDTDTVVDSMGFPGRKASARAPIAGTVVQGSFDYTDMKVKSGQTIRVVVKVSGGSSAPDGGFFPDILLTLK